MLRASLIILCILLFLIVSCSEKKVTDPEDAMVAKVGDHVITVRDFRRNYEFGLPHLKKGPDKKRSYLEYMIKEQILSQQGYRLNLDKAERVRKQERELMNELLVEALFDEEVKNKITVSNEEISNAINQSKVQWKMRYWFEPDRDYAERICQAMRAYGYANVLEDILQRNPELNLKPEHFESKYLTWLEVNPDLLEVIKDLPVGDISDPVEINGGYFIFQVVDIRREALSEYDYQDKAESIRQILFYRKLSKEAAKYVSGLMTPKNVVTKGDAFRKLSNALEQWRDKEPDKPEEFLPSVLSAQETEGSLYELKTILGQTLVSFQDGSWTVKDFLDRFDPKSIKVNKEKGQAAFRSALNNQIALEVRDDFMIKEARKKDLQESPHLLSELQMWKDKWVYQEVRRHYPHDLNIDEKQTREYFEKYKDRFKIRWDDEPKFDAYHNQAKRLAYIENARNLLTQKADSLATTSFPVFINQAVLDTIATIEFQKSHWASLQVFKRSSNRLACPIVDPAWGF
jgi:hypothetical protein